MSAARVAALTPWDVVNLIAYRTVVRFGVVAVAALVWQVVR